MDAQSDKYVMTFVAFADSVLLDESQQFIAELCKFKDGLFSEDKKYHLFRETAFLALFLIHSVSKSKNISSEKINLVFNLIYSRNFQGKEDIQLWFSHLLKKINQYIASASSEKAGGALGIAGAFLISLKSFDNTLPGFEQFKVAIYIDKLFEALTQAIDKHGN